MRMPFRAQLYFKFRRIGGAGEPRPLTEPCVRFSYTALHVNFTHFIISNQWASCLSEITNIPNCSVNQSFGKAFSTALS